MGNQSSQQRVSHWKPDYAVTHCEGCRLEFTVFKRRHHCRDCGGIFCAPCSSESAPIPWRQFSDPVRVCHACKESIRSLLSEKYSREEPQSEGDLLGTDFSTGLGDWHTASTSPLAMLRYQTILDDSSKGFLPHVRGEVTSLYPIVCTHWGTHMGGPPIPPAIASATNSIALLWRSASDPPSAEATAGGGSAREATLQLLRKLESAMVMTPALDGDLVLEIIY